MCVGKAMLIRRGQTEPDYLLDSNDHQPLLEKFNLKDDTLNDRNFVRVELWPARCGVRCRAFYNGRFLFIERNL